MCMDRIADGTHDVIVVSVDEGEQGRTTIEIAFTSGVLKGATTALVSSMPIDRALDLLGLPAALVVEQGRPRLVTS